MIFQKQVQDHGVTEVGRQLIYNPVVRQACVNGVSNDQLSPSFVVLTKTVLMLLQFHHQKRESNFVKLICVIICSLLILNKE